MPLSINPEQTPSFKLGKVEGLILRTTTIADLNLNHIEPRYSVMPFALCSLRFFSTGVDIHFIQVTIEMNLEIKGFNRL